MDERSEERLHESEDQLRRLADALPILVSYIDKNERYQFVNKLYERWFGTPREIILGRTIREILGDETYLGRRPQIEAALRGEHVHFEALTPTKDGIRETELHYVPRYGAGGSMEGLYVVGADITDRKRAERALHQARAEAERQAARTATILAQLAEGVIVTDSTGRITFINDAAVRIHGIAQLGVSPKDYAAVYNLYTENGLPFPSEELPLARAALRGETVEDVRWRIHRPDGRQVIAVGSARPILMPEGERAGAVLTFRDDTARVSAEAALQSLNATLEAQVADRTAERDRIWQNSHELMGVFELDGYRKAINPAWTRVLGYDEATMLATPFGKIAHPDDRQKLTAVLQSLARGERVEFEDRLRHADGSYRHLAWTAVPGDGLFYVIGRDMTEHRQAEEALRQAQKMEAVGQLTGGVAHDFNNLLTIIRSSVDFLRRRSLPEDRRRRYMDAISDTVDRASKLTGQLLAFARRQALKPEVFDVAKRIQTVADMLRTIVGSRIHIELEVACETCFIEADVSQFETALLNMAANARDAMDGDGILSIHVRELPGIPALRGHGSNPGHFVAISLTDTGSGIPPESLPHVFEPFYTTKGIGKGTGLGLSQVYGFAKQSGGDVSVESEVGRGTTFTLYLPRTMHDVMEFDTTEENRTTPVEHGHGRRVLVVEDNREVGTFSTQLLQDLGYETTWATNGDQALALLDQGLAIDVIFSDVVMPGMDGVELGQEIRRRYPSLPIVLTSGYSDVLAEEGRHGFELLHKPYAAEELSRVLRRVMRGLDAR